MLIKIDFSKLKKKCNINSKYICSEQNVKTEENKYLRNSSQSCKIKWSLIEISPNSMQGAAKRTLIKIKIKFSEQFLVP